MKPKRNVFSYFVIILYLIGILYILVCGISCLGEGQEYPYLPQGIFLVFLLGLWLLVNGITAMAARLELEDKVKRHRRVFWVLEAIFVVGMLCLAACLRWHIIKTMPVKPDSDFKTYYEIAELLERGVLVEEGEGLCKYISLFPHVFGYPFALSLVFRFWGIGVFQAQIFNLILAIGTVFLTYRTSRLIGGVLSGFAALVLTTVWPSQIFYINMVTSEYLFSFLFILCVYLFTISLKKCKKDMKHPALGVILHVLIGIFLALCISVKPEGVILLIAIIICIFFQKIYIKAKTVVEQPISLIILSKGWARCVIIVVCYLCVSRFCFMGIEYILQRNVAVGSASLGYDFWVGLNADSEGGWNQPDSDFLYNTLETTGDAAETQLVCRDLAIQRMSGNPKRIANLLLNKFQTVWAKDNFGSTWNIFLMEQQGILTDSVNQYLYASCTVSNLFYLIVAAFAGIEGVFLWKKGMDYEYLFTLVFVGTVGLYLLTVNQERFHYHVLFMFAFMASSTIKDTYRMNRAKVLSIREEKERQERIIREDRERFQRRVDEEIELIKLREEAMKSRFNMEEALEKGWIKVSVTEQYDEKK